MQTRVLALVVIVCAMLAGLPVPAAAGTGEIERLVVTSRAGVSAGGVATHALEHVPSGARITDSGEMLTSHGVTVLEVPAAAVERIERQLAEDPAIAAVERDVPVRATGGVIPDDPLFDGQWALDVLRASDAWVTTTGSAEVTIAVIDTGVSPHADLDGALAPGWNTLEATADARDDHGHGTAVAGAAAARADNGIGVAGLCWTCTILPVKALDDEGIGQMSDVAAGVVWAVDNGADVINLSLGGSNLGSAMDAALDHAAAGGVLVVGAAGNGSSTAQTYPAADARVLGVAGSDEDDVRYSWSNHGSWVDVTAPGCTLTTGFTDSGAEGYGPVCGTSLAAPLVAATAALALDIAPATTVAELRAAVGDGSVPQGYVAAGRIDVVATLALLPEVEEPEVEEPEVEEPEVEEPDAEEPEDEHTGDDEPDAEEPVVVCELVAPTTFSDTLGNVHAGGIGCVAGLGVARGYADGTFRPHDAVRRDQLASFVAAGLRAAGVTLPDVEGRFADITGNPHGPAIEQLAALGVIGGVGGDAFAPSREVTRAQVATFLAGAYAAAAGVSLPAGAAVFPDVANSAHRGSINALAAAGVVGGYHDGTFRPDAVVTRDALATFLARTLQRVADEGIPVTPLR